MKLGFSITLVCCLFVNTVIGQDILYYPENPTWEDSITVICGVFSASSPCMLLSSELLMENMEFTAELCHIEGMLSSPCVSSDTFRIKVPDDSPGVYTFNCVLNLNNDNTLPFDSSCTEYAWTHTVQIPVSNPLTVSGHDERWLEVFPNPVADKAVVRLPQNTQLRMVRVSDMQGREFERFCANGMQHFDLDLSSYINGLYLVEVVLYDGNRGVQRLVVQH